MNSRHNLEDFTKLYVTERDSSTIDTGYSLKSETMSSKKQLDPATSKVGKEIVSSIALHPNFMKELAKVAEVSYKKGYSPFNWIQKDSPCRVSTFLAAAKRHIIKAELGYNVNSEKTLEGEDIPITANHLSYAAYNLLMAVQLINHLPEHDDRLFLNGDLK